MRGMKNKKKEKKRKNYHDTMRGNSKDILSSRNILSFHQIAAEILDEILDESSLLKRSPLSPSGCCWISKISWKVKSDDDAQKGESNGSLKQEEGNHSNPNSNKECITGNGQESKNPEKPEKLIKKMLSLLPQLDEIDHSFA